MPSPEPNWYAVTTRSRHEKVVAEQWWQKQIECFLPLREGISKWKDRKKKVQFPLVPGYRFVHVPIQVEALERLVFSTPPCDPDTYIAEGDRMEIVRGPLKGLQGILIEKKGESRFILSIDLIQQAVACEVDACGAVKAG